MAVEDGGLGPFVASIAFGLYAGWPSPSGTG